MAGQISSSSRPNQIRDDGNDQAEYLSLGFELEVIFATLKPELEDKEMFDGAIWRGTPEEFDSDSDSDSDSELDPEEFEYWLIKHLEGNMPGESFLSWRSSESINGYDTWRTKKTEADYDTGTTYGHRPATTQYDWKSREIASPILSTKDNQWVQQVHNICRAIRNARIHLNESTTVSVHVGRGREIFSLLEMQKFITLLWLTDHMIMSMHHPGRYEHVSCLPITKESRLAKKSIQGLMVETSGNEQQIKERMHRFVPVTLLEESGDDRKIRQLLCIWASDSVEDLAWLADCGLHARGNDWRAGSVGFTNFMSLDKPGGDTHTLEWRQMAGSLDPQHISLWIRFCIYFTNFTRLASADVYKAVLKEILGTGESFTMSNLLQRIGLGEDITFWEERMKRYAEGNCDLYDGQSGRLFVPPLESD